MNSAKRLVSRRPATKTSARWIVDGSGNSNVELAIFRVDAWLGEPHAANDEHTKIAWFDIDAACALPNLASDRYPELFKTVR